MPLNKLISSNSSPFSWLAISVFLIIGFAYPTNALADSLFPKCFVGTYLIEEGNGTKSLWTLGSRGAIIITSSAQKILNFSTEQGSWEKSGRHEAKATLLDFSFDENEELLNIARVDATIRFNGNNCSDVEGDFIIRFFDPEQDPLNPVTDLGNPISDTFTGRRVSVEK